MLQGERIVQKGNICEKLESEVLLLPPPETAALSGDIEEVTGQVRQDPGPHFVHILKKSQK